MMEALSAPSVTTVPLDVGYLRAQGAQVHSGEEAESWYLQNGLARCLDPTPFFVTDWYAWQNPDWTSFAAPYLHYLEVGRHEGRDPSPFVDMRRFLDATACSEAGAAYDLILRGVRSPALGVYENREDLRRYQRGFLQAISCTVHRARRPVKARKALVVLQAGPASVAGSWFDDRQREWDLLVNYYDARGFQPGLGDYVFFQKGTKFSAMWMLWSHYRDVLSGYDHVLFLDDDIATDCDSLNRLFRACRQHRLDLAQMALTEDSSCNWPELYSRAGAVGPRELAAVEIMMPVFSAKALKQVAPTFGKSVSGFGLDLVWGKIVKEAGGRIAVLDDILATHARPVDQAGGAYYSYLRRHGLNAKAELWTLANDYGTTRAMGL